LRTTVLSGTMPGGMYTEPGGVGQILGHGSMSWL
jgi:hypothetical protein